MADFGKSNPTSSRSQDWRTSSKQNSWHCIHRCESAWQNDTPSTELSSETDLHNAQCFQFRNLLSAWRCTSSTFSLDSRPPSVCSSNCPSPRQLQGEYYLKTPRTASKLNIPYVTHSQCILNPLQQVVHVAGIVFFFFYFAFLKSVSKKCGLRRKSIAWLFPTHLRNQEHKSRGCSAKFISISSYFTKIKSIWKLHTSISPPAAEAAFAVCSQSHTSPWGFCETNRGSWNQQNKRCCWSFIRSLHSIRKQINNRRKYWEVWVPTYQLFLLKRKGKRGQQTSCSRSCYTQ